MSKLFSRIAAAALVLTPIYAHAAPKPAIDPNAPKIPATIEGWKVEVLRQVPQIHFPSVVCAAPDGRIFVSEDPMDMIGPGNQPGDRILCIHPDGHTTVFADHLYAVFGIAYIDGKVYVHHSPKFTVFTDDNGIGKNPVDFINCTNPRPWGGGSLNDHIPAGFHLAMDNWIYMASGDKGVYGAESNIDHSKVELQGGGLIRFRPDGTHLENYASGTRNHLDVSINPEDEMFTYDNTDDGQGWWTRFTHMVDGGFYGYPYDYRPAANDPQGMADFRSHRERGAQPFKPYTLWRAEEYGGGSPTGAIAYNEDALPPEYRGNVFHSEWGKGQLERFVVQRSGGTFKVALRQPFLMRGNGPDLRPLGVAVTPDGMGFYVCDWNYGGWNNKSIDSGRLIKVSYAGPSLAAPKPEWFIPAAEGKTFAATTQDLVAGLSHPAQSVRLVAQRRIAERGAEAMPMLIALLKDSKAPAHARWHAIWTMDLIDQGKAGREAIISVLSDASADVSVRMQAARQLGTQKAAQATQPLMAALNDPDAAMRFRAATALGRIGNVAAAQPLLDHLTETDFFTHFAMFTALHRIALADPSAWGPIVKGLSASSTQVREGAVFAMRNAYDASLATALASFADDAKNTPEARAAAVSAMAGLHRQVKPWDGHWWGTQPVAGSWPAHTVDWAGTAPIGESIAHALKDNNGAVRLAAIQALQMAPDSTSADTLASLFKAEADPAMKKAILRALAACKPSAAGEFVAAILADPSANADLVPDAIGVARQVASPAMAASIASVISGNVPPEILVPALETLEKIRDPKTVPAIAKRIADRNDKVAEAATRALGAIASPDSADALIAALKDNRAHIRRNSAQALARVRSRKAIEPLVAIWRDPDMTREAVEALAATPDIRALDAYLEGLSSKDGGTRDRCRRAISSIKATALPLIEKRMDQNPLPTATVVELQKIYSTNKDSKLFKYDTQALSPEVYAEFAMSHPGDPANGLKLFTAENGVGCIKCHRVGNVGGEIGPALIGVGAKYDQAKLIESVLYPSKQILDGYQQVIVRTKKGDVEAGIIKGETDTELTLVDSAAQKIVIKKSTIDRRKFSEQSLMPEGLHAGLKPQEFSDLIAYLQSLKEAGK
jgi:putative membrane-bound dehydrogenase-like protein